MVLPDVSACRVISLAHQDDAHGSVTILERLAEFPFEMRRVSVITNVPSGRTHGRHANMHAAQLILCATGAITVRVEDGRSTRSIPLSSQSGAVLVPRALWMELRDFAPATVVLILADTDARAPVHDCISERARWLRARAGHHVE